MPRTFGCVRRQLWSDLRPGAIPRAADPATLVRSRCQADTVCSEARSAAPRTRGTEAGAVGVADQL